MPFFGTCIVSEHKTVFKDQQCDRKCASQ